MSQEVLMDVLTVPIQLREKLDVAGSDGLVMMFAEAHRIGAEQRLDRRLAEVSAGFERRLKEEISAFRRRSNGYRISSSNC